jgi:hypothetical protein
VSEADRLSAAFLCVLTAQCDAVLKNVFLSPEGRPVLLNLDTCLGRPVWWGPACRICFAPGGALAYADETLQQGWPKSKPRLSPIQRTR